MAQHNNVIINVFIIFFTAIIYILNEYNFGLTATFVTIRISINPIPEGSVPEVLHEPGGTQTHVFPVGVTMFGARAVVVTGVPTGVAIGVPTGVPTGVATGVPVGGNVGNPGNVVPGKVVACLPKTFIEYKNC